MGKLHGRTLGLKPGQIRGAEKLFRRRIDPQRALTHELARELSRMSIETKRCFGLVLDRAGRVQRVAVGDANHVPFPDPEEAPLAPGRLCGLRFVRTALKAGPLSRPDVQLLARHRLDLVARVHAGADGEPVDIRMAHLLPPSPELGRVRELDPLSPNGLPADFLELMDGLEEEFRRTADSTQASGTSERALLLGVELESDADHSPLSRSVFEKGRSGRESLAELRELARSCGMEVVHERLQRRQMLDRKTVVGLGVLEELVHLAVEHEANLLVLDREISPLQVRELERATGLRVMDRTMLILSIFERRAVTRDGKRRVELARLRHRLPHLSTHGSHFSRQGGGRGAGAVRGGGGGEKQIERDRRTLKDRIRRLERDLVKIGSQREERRKNRRKAGIFTVALVGYTNAGKSTLFRALTREDVVARDLLFATLDTTTRRVWLGEGNEALLIDTVGFIRDLPPDLVDAFRATLEEIATADLLLHLVDASTARWPGQVRAVRETLDELGCAHLPELLVFNKKDRADLATVAPHARERGGMLISALEENDVHRVRLLLADRSSASADQRNAS